MAEYAARARHRALGAEVKVFDNHLYKLRRLKHNLGTQLYTSTLDTYALEPAKSAGPMWLSGRWASRTAVFPTWCPKKWWASMSSGSVIIDVEH